MTSIPGRKTLPVLAPSDGDGSSRRPSLPPRRRTNRSNACTACRARRTKCGGGQPCDKCVELGSQCVFDESLDRRKKYAQRRAEQELSSAQQMLNRVVEAFDAGDTAKLAELLSIVRDDRSRQGQSQQRDLLPSNSEQSSTRTDSQDSSTFTLPVPSDNTRRASASSASSVSVGSLNEVDTLTEDPNRNLETRAAGYIGKGSEIAWMQRLGFEASNLEHGSHQRQTPIEESISSMDYHLDSLHLEDTLPVEPRLLPPKPWATRLLDIFFESVAPSFPLINKPLFISQFNHAFTNSAEPTETWLAVLNLVFAISSKYYQLAEPAAGKDVDDRNFLSRAISLTTSETQAIDLADLHRVQIDFLLAMYFLASGQINRSWQMNGRAARSATSLGLNLRALSDQIDPVSNETRTRIWWCIFYLENLLSAMTGRSACIDYRSISQYPPVPFDEDLFNEPQWKELLGNPPLREERLQWTLYASDSQLEARKRWFQSISPNQSLFFYHLLDLSVISHVAVTSIYDITYAKEFGQSRIRHYQEKFRTWLSSLQPPFAFTDRSANPTVDRDHRGQVSLALAYYSSQIVITRPCLTRPEKKEGTNTRHPRSQFRNDMTRTCLRNAHALISVFPDEPSSEWILTMTPWWCILHFTMQALTVLLIQLSVGPVPFVDSHGEERPQIEGNLETAEEQELLPEFILESSKKALRWLHTLAETDPSARRAFELSESFIRRIGSAKGLDLSGVPPAEDLTSDQQRSDPSSRQGSNERARSLASPFSNLDPFHHNEEMNWGADCTKSELGNERHQYTFALDPTLLSLDQ